MASPFLSFTDRLSRSKEIFSPPPLSNTGGTSEGKVNDSILVGIGKEKFIVPMEFISSFNGCDSIQLVSGRGSAFIDTFSFTFKSTAFYREFPSYCAISDCGDDYVSAVSSVLTDILGFGVTSKNNHGKNFYKYSYQLGANFGWLGVGGENQKDSLQIYLNSQGLLVSTEGWQKRLFDFLKLVDAKITRSDLARDCFNGEYTVDSAYSDHLDGKYKDKFSPKNPTGAKSGCWDFEQLGLENEGRTYYIGNRKSSKFLRVYEKGLQMINKFNKDRLFSEFNNWVRIELELKGSDRKIPYDVLLHPEVYLAGAYAALDFVSEVQEKIKIITKHVNSDLHKMKGFIKNQCGKILNYLRDVFCTDESDSDKFVDSKIVTLFNDLVRQGYPSHFHHDLGLTPEQMDFSAGSQEDLIAKAF